MLGILKAGEILLGKSLLKHRIQNRNPRVTKISELNPT